MLVALSGKIRKIYSFGLTEFIESKRNKKRNRVELYPQNKQNRDDEKVNKIVEKLNKTIENMSKEERIKLLSRHECGNGSIDFATLQKENPELVTGEDILEWAGGDLYWGVNSI